MLQATTLGADLAPIGGGSSGITVFQADPNAAKRLASQMSPISQIAPIGPAGAYAATTTPAATPWYKNWKIMVPAGLGGAVAVGLIVWAVKGS